MTFHIIKLEELSVFSPGLARLLVEQLEFGTRFSKLPLVDYTLEELN